MCVKGVVIIAQTVKLGCSVASLVDESRNQDQAFHIAVTRMIAQGTDRVSRGFLGQGVMDGAAMSAFVPIHMSAVERTVENFVPWIRRWAGKEAFLLREIGWF